MVSLFIGLENLLESTSDIDVNIDFDGIVLETSFDPRVNSSYGRICVVDLFLSWICCFVRSYDKVPLYLINHLWITFYALVWTKIL